jgi:phage shock protein E
MMMLIDVRTNEEFKEGHYPGAVNVPLEDIFKGKLTSHKDEEIKLYCRSGGRAGRAREALVTQGFINVTNIGGYSA